MRAGLLFLDGIMRGMFRIFGFEDNDFLKILVTLQNTLNRKAFMAVPVEERAVFMPSVFGQMHALPISMMKD